MMTLEDAIQHAEEVAKEKEEASKRWKECKDSQTIEWSKLYFDSVEEIIEKCDKCATEHRQLAEWLRELKERREKDVLDTNAKDMISRQEAIALADTLMRHYSSSNEWIAYTTIAHNEAIWEYQTALTQLSSIQSEYTCVGCKHREKWENEIEYGYPSPCTRCKRRASDNYEQCGN